MSSKNLKKQPLNHCQQQVFHAIEKDLTHPPAKEESVHGS